MSLLKLLSDGRFHSGEELGQQLGLSRSAIWKRLNGLQNDFGLEIFKVPGRGYRLAEPLHLLGLSDISQRQFWPVDILDSIDSTNIEAQRRLRSGEAPPFVLLAEHQQAGRGRRGRTWVSPYGKNLYLTAVATSMGGIQRLEGLSLTLGLAVIETLQRLGISEARLKWPNDVLLQGRKLAGILIELSGDPHDACQVVMGIGMNVNMRSAEDIDQPWISLVEVIGTALDRSYVSRLLLEQVQRHWLKHQQLGFVAFREEWERFHDWQGQAVVLSSGPRTIHGIVEGIAENGAIRLNIDGQIEAFSGGELSLSLNHDS